MPKKRTKYEIVVPEAPIVDTDVPREEKSEGMFTAPLTSCDEGTNWVVTPPPDHEGYDLTIPPPPPMWIAIPPAVEDDVEGDEG